MVIAELSADLTAAALVDALPAPHRCFQAYQRLQRLGPAAGAAARLGLRHASAQVREYCCLVLDRLMDLESAAALVEALDDPAEQVRLAAVHALACERCKEGSWRPSAGAVLPRAIPLLAADEPAHVRAMAVQLVGHAVTGPPPPRSPLERPPPRAPSPPARA